MELRITIREEPSGKWVASTEGKAPADASGATMERCLANLRRALDRSGRGGVPATLVVQVVPRLAGVAEAASIMGWDKRRVITYIPRELPRAPAESRFGACLVRLRRRAVQRGMVRAPDV